MTCIVGLVDSSKVYIGGDSAGVEGYELVVRADAKVFRNSPMLFGFTTSFRMGQLLRYSLTIPDHDPRVGIDKYMATTFIDAVRSCLKAGGYSQKSNEQETGGRFLVGYQGQLFYVDNDYQVGKLTDGFAAVGCGAQIAHGALFATNGQEPALRVLKALEAAERFSTGVRAPFLVEVLE